MTQSSRSVLFTDTTGQGFSRNLVVLRDELLVARQDLPLTYFFADLDSAEATAGEQRVVKGLLSRASSDAGWVVTASDSKHVRHDRVAQDQRRVLLLSPRLASVAGGGGRVEGYTDVVLPGAAFLPSAQRRFPHARVHAAGLPAFTELVSDGRRDSVRRSLTTLCPGSHGKRIVVVTTQRSPQKVFGATGVRELAALLPEDVFLILDVPGLLPTLESEPAALADHVFVNDGAFGVFGLLALADVLVTSKFHDAVYFSVTGRRLITFTSKRKVAALADKLPADYEALGIADVSDLPSALCASYDEAARLRFQAVYAVPDPESSLSRLVQILFP